MGYFKTNLLRIIVRDILLVKSLGRSVSFIWSYDCYLVIFQTKLYLCKSIPPLGYPATSITFYACLLWFC